MCVQVMTVFYIDNIKILIIYSWFPAQVVMKPPYFYTSDQPNNRSKNNQSVELVL